MNTVSNPMLERLSAAMDTFLSEVSNVVHVLHEQANTQRKQLLDVLAAMQNTQLTLDGISTICEEGAEVLDNIAEDCDELNCKMTDAMEDPVDACPTCNFEELLGFCEHCGAAVTVANLGECDDGDLFCNDCSPAEDESESEVELAESVEPIGEI